MNFYGMTFEEACRTGNVHAVRAMAEDANGNPRALPSIEEALRISLRHSPDSANAILTLLLQHGAQIDDRSWKNGGTLLHQACDYPHAPEGAVSDVIDTLLDQDGGAHLLEARDHDYRTALMNASRNAVPALLRRGARLDVVDREGRNALHFQASAGQDEVVGILLESGLDVDSTDNRGWTALHYAIKHRWLGTAGLLLNEWGAALDVLDRKGRCAFEIATRNPRVQALLREDIDQCYTMTILK